jgi:hypothetical protein
MLGLAVALFEAKKDKKETTVKGVLLRAASVAITLMKGFVSLVAELVMWLIRLIKEPKVTIKEAAATISHEFEVFTSFLREDDETEE